MEKKHIVKKILNLAKLYNIKINATKTTERLLGFSKFDLIDITWFNKKEMQQFLKGGK